MAHNPKDIIRFFQLEGEFQELAPCGSGHINDTYTSSFRVGGKIVRYVHQWINHHVFKDPARLMENIERVTSYIRQRVISNGGDPTREVLTLVAALDGRSFYQTPQGDFWRTYTFIDGAQTYDTAENLQYVYNASKAFGNFQKLLGELPGGRLHETIPDFHHTRKRFDTFIHILEADPANRARLVKPEIDFIIQRENETSVVLDLLESGQIPERVTHNDTKLNNVMIDDRTGEGICVIDLDTVMPGSVLYDFGDSVRIGASTAAEDEQDLSQVGFDLSRFEWLAQGYLDAAREFLSPIEIEHLAFSARLITLEQAIRFLGDYLNGDIYYKIHYPHHNLVRARTQLKMLAEMERQEEAMYTIVNRYR
jgi:Ser/Thr protein kinase RdoA (MazF antagonist)